MDGEVWDFASRTLAKVECIGGIEFAFTRARTGRSVSSVMRSLC